jgi:hypothetical protein
MSAGVQDGVVEGVAVDKASDNHCSRFLPLARTDTASLYRITSVICSLVLSPSCPSPNQ